MIILAAVAIIVLLGYNYFMNRTGQESESFYNKAVSQMMDNATPDRTYDVNYP